MKVKVIIKKIASSYRLSASELDVNDNGDGTANVKFEVFADLERSDIPFRDVKSVGLYFEYKHSGCVLSYSVLSKKSSAVRDLMYILLYIHTDPIPANKKYSEVRDFMDSELMSLVLSVKLGKYEAKEKLWLEWGALRSHLSMKYNTKMTLLELKSLSQLKLKILYDSEEYGQQSEFEPNKRYDYCCSLGENCHSELIRNVK